MPVSNLQPFFTQPPSWINYDCTLNGAAENIMTVSSSNVHVSVLSGTQGMAFASTTAQGQKAKILTLSGSSITVESEFDITNALSRPIATSTIDSTRVLVFYISITANPNLWPSMRILSVSGTTISEGAEFNITDGQTNALQEVLGVYVIDTGRALIIHKNLSGQMVARVASFSGTTISSVGSTVLIDGSTTPIIEKITKVDTERFIISYDNGTAAILKLVDVSGTTVTVQDSQTISSAVTDIVVRPAAISPTNFLVAYNNTASGDLVARGCTISGSTITLGTEVALGFRSVAFNLEFMKDNELMLVGYDATATSVNRGKAMTLNGLTFTQNGTCTFGTPPTNMNNTDTWMQRIDDNRLLYISDTTGFVHNARVLSIV